MADKTIAADKIKPEAAKPEIKPNVVPRARDLSEFRKKDEMQGDKVSVTDILGIPLVIERFDTRDSQYEGTDEYMAVQVVLEDGKRVWFNTGSVVLVKVLERYATMLPLKTKIVERKGGKWGRYYDFE